MQLQNHLTRQVPSLIPRLHSGSTPPAAIKQEVHSDVGCVVLFIELHVMYSVVDG